MYKFYVSRQIIAAFLIFTVLAVGCGNQENKTLVIFHAGSLAVPFKQLAKRFEASHPGVSVTLEAAGSRDTARKISDLKRPCDVVASADYTVIDNLLVPDHVPHNIRFAANEMAIAYTDRSKYASEINADNWPEIFLRRDTVFGRAEPNSDPCGYRTVMVFKLAQDHYGRKGLAEKLTKKGGKRFIRPKETDLLGLLEAGEIDYLPIYKSVASQHGLKMIDLPARIDLSSTAHMDFYKTATVEVTGKNPGETTTLHGKPIVYSVAIPKSSPNPKLAAEFVALLLSKEGRQTIESNGQTAIVPALVTRGDVLPGELGGFCKEI